MNDRKILVADDEDSIRLVLRNTLKQRGYVVVTAENGSQAWELIQTQDFDLIDRKSVV